MDDNEHNKLFDKKDVEVSLSSSSDEEESYRPSKKVLLTSTFSNATLCLTTTTIHPFKDMRTGQQVIRGGSPTDEEVVSDKVL